MAPAVLALVSALLAGALPPPPKQVVLTGRGTFGEIHFDHEAHLGRRIACKACHGPGPVQKPELSPAWGHETCRACHVDQKTGPTSCRDCHQNVKEAGAAAAGGTETTASASPSSSTPTATSAPSPRPSPPADAGGEGGNRGAALPTPPPPPTASGRSEDLSLRRTGRAGLAMMSGGARTGAGIGVDLTLEQGRWVAETVVAWSNRPGAERTLALFGLGASHPFGPLARARAVALCGIDTGSPAYLLPAVGLRAGVELRSPRPGFSALPSADLSLAYVRALGTRLDESGEPTPEAALVFSVLFGWQLPGP